MPEVVYSLETREGNSATLVSNLIVNAIDHLPEFTWQSSPEEAYRRISWDIRRNDRLEILAKVKGRVVGAVVMTSDFDCQVGELISVQWFYVDPNYRGKVGRKLVRLSREVAKCNDFRVMAFTHRISEGRYEINYRKLEVSKDGQESSKGR